MTCCVAEKLFGKKGGMRSETGIVGVVRTGLGDRGVDREKGEGGRNGREKRRRG